MKIFDELDEEVDMNSKDTKIEYKQLVEKILEQVNLGQHSKWEFIINLTQYFETQILIKTYKKFIKSFKKINKSLVKKQIKCIKANNYTSLDTSLAIRQFLDAIIFYKKEIDILKDMINEYQEFLLSGHLIESLSGLNRSYEDLYDFRNQQ